MVRQDCDPAMVGTSIALLQERFRQLQKDKQRREELELVKISSGSTRVRRDYAMHFDEPANLSLQPEKTSLKYERLSLVPSHERGLWDPPVISFGCNYTRRKQIQSDRDHQGMKIPALASTSKDFENSDVDTTLHL